MDAARRPRRLEPLERLGPRQLLVSEIFASIQGESTWAGLPCVFVRTAVCNLRCAWCDTRYAFAGGEVMDVDAVVARVRASNLPLVEVTGGEPLLQPAVLPLMSALCDAELTVLLETSGSLDIRPVDPRAHVILDLKTPSSGESGSNLYANLAHLRPKDEVKLVVADRADYEWARARLAEHGIAARCHVLMGPVHGRIDPRDLAAWILEDRLPVRLQLQLHKLIWDPSARGV